MKGKGGFPVGLKIIEGAPLLEHRKMLVRLGLKALEEKAAPLFFIVPNHIKFVEEVSLLKEISHVKAQQAFIQTQVFSFSRLAWYFLKNTSFYGRFALSEVGVSLLLKKVFLAQEAELVLLKSQGNAPGFMAQLGDLFEEFQKGKVTPSLLEVFIAEAPLKPGEKEKLSELQRLYEAYLTELKAYEFRDASLLDALGVFFLEHPEETGIFVFSGFQQFSKEELDLIKILLKTHHEVLIDWVTRPDFPNFLNWLPEEIPELKSFCEGEGISVATQELAAIPVSPAKRLADFWGQSFTKVLDPVKETSVENYLQLAVGQTAYEEVLGVATEISRLVRGGVRYQEITVYLRDSALYQELIENIFSLQGIPVMFSTPHAMKDHPLVEFLESLFLIHERNYQYPDVMRLLKTGFLTLLSSEELTYEGWQKEQVRQRKMVDVFENILLKNDFSGSDFTKESWKLLSLPQDASEGLENDPEYQKEKALEDFANAYKDQLVALLQPFFKALKKASNGKEAATLLYRFLIQSGVKRHLEFLAQEATETGKLSQGKNHQQTWQALNQLLEEYVAIFAEVPFSYEDFRELLGTGLKELTYDQIPQTLDQVQVEKLESVLPQVNDYVFVLGLDEESLPQKIQNKTLLTDEEREKMMASAQNEGALIFSTQRENEKENLYFYHLLTAASKKVYFSYPRQKENGSLNPSSFLLRIKNHFSLSFTNWQALQGEENTATTLDRLSSFRQLLRDYSGAVSLMKKEVVLHPFWQEVPQILRDSPEKELYFRLSEEWEKKNLPVSLKAETVTELYSHELMASVSKMESFYDCQYQFYLRYGLRLKERELFQLNSQITGQFFHKVLDQLFKIILHNQQTLKNLTPIELKKFLTETFELVLQERQYGILLRNSRMNYLKEKLIATLTQVVHALDWQMKNSQSQVLGTEWFFDGKQTYGLKGPHFSLGKGEDLYLRGVIDRIDVTFVDKIPYLTVVDYKSSPHEFSYADAYYGLAMQMLSYLDVVLAPQNQKVLKETLQKKGLILPGDAEFLGAGALYLHVKNPELKPEKATEKDLLKEFQYQGLLLQEEPLLEEMAQDISKRYSTIYPIEKVSTGIRVLESQKVTQENLDLLIAGNRKNLEKAGKEILKGEIALNPSYHDKQRIACTYCPFRSICRFDVLMPENNYRVIEKLKKAEVINRLKEEQDDTH